MARERIPIGRHGEIMLLPRGNKRWEARVYVRDSDGKRRLVSATRPSKGAAQRALTQRLQARTESTNAGATASMTVRDLGAYWLAHREAHGKARGRGPIAPQSLAAYRDSLEYVVFPALGDLRIAELTVGILDSVLARIELGTDRPDQNGVHRGRSTAGARTSLAQMLDLAVKHGAISSNPMRLVEPTSRAPKHAGGVEHLTVAGALSLRRRVRPEELRVPGARRGSNGDLKDWVDVLLGSGGRDGEVLALRWCDVGLDADLPTAHICGTLVEPRRGYVEKLHRQDRTKSGTGRLLILPAHVVRVLQKRRERSGFTEPNDPVFATRTGGWISPANMRTRLRNATAGVNLIDGCTPHTLRRTVGTLVAHEAGLDAAREQLGHSDPSVTYQHYVGRRVMAPDLRSILDAFFAPLDPSDSDVDE